ncbi:hypothetical protein ACYZX9_03660 [Sphingomonas citri]
MADDRPTEEDGTGRAFMVFAAELDIVADQMQGQVPLSPVAAPFGESQQVDVAAVEAISTPPSREVGEDEVSAARAGGEQAGSDLGHLGSENPYGHDVFQLRTAWFKGFSAGRVRSAHERGENY